jgi:hypothetical protein
MDEAGATTAEYAVGTLGAASIGAILVYLGADPSYRDMLWDLIRYALDPNLLLHHLSSLPRLSGR